MSLLFYHPLCCRLRSSLSGRGVGPRTWIPPHLWSQPLARGPPRSWGQGGRGALGPLRPNPSAADYGVACLAEGSALARGPPRSWGQGGRRASYGRPAGGTTPGPEDQGPPVLGPVGGAHRPWDRRWAYHQVQVRFFLSQKGEYTLLNYLAAHLGGLSLQ